MQSKIDKNAYKKHGNNAIFMLLVLLTLVFAAFARFIF